MAQDRLSTLGRRAPLFLAVTASSVLMIPLIQPAGLGVVRTHCRQKPREADLGKRTRKEEMEEN